jgi:ergothioneine biosynthesis protein EgtB
MNELSTANLHTQPYQLIKDRYIQIRQKTESICEPLLPEDFVAQPVVDVSPPKWHLGHTTWFFEEFVLKQFSEIYTPFNPDYCYIFNSYYESVGERIQRNSRGNLTRPPLKEIYDYRTYVNEKLTEAIQKGNLPQKALELIELGLHHEQQHQELLITDIKYIFSCNPLLPIYKQSNSPTMSVESKPVNFLTVEEGVYSIGYRGSGFCYDNEKGVHKVFVHPFKVADRLITNGEFFEFMQDQGYQRFEFWLSEGWEWIKQNHIKSPLYWIKKGAKWHEFTMHGLREIDLNLPVTHISHFEADAYATWAGKRLLTEFEWEVAAQKYTPNLSQIANLQDNMHFHPLASSSQNMQFLGDCWEWTNSAYLPYPYFQKVEGPVGEYNGKFMINQMVLRGGSCATPSNHIRHTYRNFFHPHLRWQFTGIRLAENN